MTRIYFVRHGESLSNAGGPAMDHLSIPLTDRGFRQAAAIVSCLPPSPPLVLTSPMLRAQQTAAAYCESTAVKAVVNPALSEFSLICRSRIEGMSGTERMPLVNAYWAAADPNLRDGPGADTFREFLDRVESFTEEMSELPNDSVIFGHGIWFALLVWRLMGFAANTAAEMTSFRQFQLEFPVSNCGVFELSRTDNNLWTGSSVLAARGCAASL